MTHLAEIKSLQSRARSAGRVCTLYFNEQGELCGVFYLDPCFPLAPKNLTPLEFAERERRKPYY